VTDLADEIRRRSAGFCEYCRIPEAAFRRPFHIEHIVAKQHGGLALLENRSLAFYVGTPPLRDSRLRYLG
jgi:hypothetical protein